MAIDLQVNAAWRMRRVGPGLIATQLAEHGIVGLLNVSYRDYAAYQHLRWTDLGVVSVYMRLLYARKGSRCVAGDGA